MGVDINLKTMNLYVYDNRQINITGLNLMNRHEITISPLIFMTNGFRIFMVRATIIQMYK